MEILFNREGTPLMLSSTSVLGESTGRPSSYDIRKRDILSPYDIRTTESSVLGNLKIMNWGHDNRFPLNAARQISTTSVLNTGLKFLRSLTVGQGIYPCKVTGWDDKGNEQLEPVSDAGLSRFVNSRMVRRYLEKVSRDYFKFGSGAVELLPNQSGTALIGIHTLNALYYRYTLPDSWGACKCVVSGEWPEMPGIAGTDGYTVLDTLMDYDPELHASWMRLAGRMNKPVVYPVRDSWSNNDFYGEPIWLPSYILGWVDIAHLVPQFLKKAYKNQITWKWHIQIPYSYWEKKFPPADYTDTATRQLAITNYMNRIEDNLCGADNAEKPLFTNYAVNEMNGKIEEEWKITALDNKYKGGDNLVTSAAANSEILFALMVNPNVFGAGMPGGSYAGNQGGSNIREAFLVNIANAWIDRQNLLDPLVLYLKSNGAGDVDLRFRNTVLTTLDSGAGTQKTLS
ncbi:MAG: hypothetical protein RR206_04830 [Bacteroidaceae bacterium]